MPATRSRLLVRFAFALLACLALAGQPGAQDAYPTRPIHLIVPFPPGGIGDATARAVTPRWSALLGQPIVIENRGGAGSNIGLDAVAKSAPDGYTIGLFDNSLVVNPSLYPNLPFDPHRDFAPIALVGRGPLVLVVNPTLPVTNVAGLIAMAKARPGVLAYASAGNGTPIHLAAEMFKSATGADILHVPYKGAGPAVTDVIGGQVPMMFSVPGTVGGQIAAGKMRALAITGARRLKSLPDVPTLTEEGVRGVDATIIVGFTAPARIPPKVLATLASTLATALASPEVADKIAAQGLDVAGSDPERTAAVLRDESDMWARVIKSAGVKLD
jgi:tripartite-type tricarboxylate transporter receptor subunit TctC